MRIAVHDYAGHPFQFDLSRQLAREGHEVRHFFYADDAGPKGEARIQPGDAPTLSIEGVSLGLSYSKEKLFQRRAMDIRYGRETGARIAAFKPDIVISGNTPVEAQGPLMAAVRKQGAGFVFWMQDFYSLAVKRILGAKWMGAGALVSAWYTFLETRQLRQSDAIVLISDDFRAGLADLGVQGADLEVIPNWGALSSLPLRPRENAWSTAQGLSGKFTFLYSGTLGLKHDPLVLTALADAFVGDPDVRVVVVAAGVGADMLRAELEARPRSNITLLPLQPMEVLADVLGSADVVLALLEADAGQFSVPSKVLSYLCAGRAIILSAPAQNLAARIIEDAKAGDVVEAGDQAAFVAAARALFEDDARRQAAGRNGRAYSEQNFDITAVSRRFLSVFERVVARKA